MTAIAYRDGFLAADTAGWQDDLHVCNIGKIVRRNGRLYAAVGRSDIIQRYYDWLITEKNLPDPVLDVADFCGIEVQKEGARIISGLTWQPVDFHRSVIALGPHAEFLYGAMAAGASAEEAVMLAIEWCAFAGGEVQVERIDGL